jgi:hypothetical protein
MERWKRGCALGGTLATTMLASSAAESAVDDPAQSALGAGAFSLAGQSLDPPDTDVTEFGAAVAAGSDYDYDYVVVGSPGGGRGGRAFYYAKSHGATVFGPPTELFQPSWAAGDRFGAAVAIDGGVIAVGAPMHFDGSPPAPARGFVYVFEQPRDVAGFPIPGSAFGPTPQAFHSLSVNYRIGSYLSYDYRNNMLVACGDDNSCNYASKYGNSWIATATSGGNRAFQDPYAPGSGYMATWSQSLNNAIDFWQWIKTPGQFGGSGYSYQQRVVSPPGFTFNGGIGGQVDRILVGVSTSVGRGFVAQYSMNIFSPNPYSQWTKNGGIAPEGAGPRFGAAIAMYGDYVLVGDPNPTPSTTSTVHQIHVDRLGTDDTSDDVWSELGTVGTFPDPSYGTAVAASPGVAVTGWSAGNKAFTVDLANPLTPVTTTDPVSGVNVTMTVVGSNMGQTTVTVDPMCATFQQDLDFSSSPPTCVDITTTAEFLGLVTICFPNHSPLLPKFAVRCHARASACRTEDGTSQTDPRTGDHLCCKLLAQINPSPPNQYCVQSDGFSAYAIGQTLDTDGDFIPDISDNCPGVPNFGQEDIDGDLVGNACDNCPGVSNQDQVDTNHNGIGDACDAAAPPAAVPSVPATGPTSASMLAFVLLLAGFRLARRGHHRRR